MSAPRLCPALFAAALLLAGAPRPAAAVDCELALAYATTAASYGQRAFASENYYDAGNLAGAARLPALDAARQAKGCGCPEAIPFLAEAALEAERSNMTSSFPSMQLFGYRIWKAGDSAVAALRRCGAHGTPPAPR